MSETHITTWDGDEARDVTIQGVAATPTDYGAGSAELSLFLDEDQYRDVTVQGESLSVGLYLADSLVKATDISVRYRSQMVETDRWVDGVYVNDVHQYGLIRSWKIKAVEIIADTAWADSLIQTLRDALLGRDAVNVASTTNAYSLPATPAYVMSLTAAFRNEIRQYVVELMAS